jgi:hypothetical protein
MEHVTSLVASCSLEDLHRLRAANLGKGWFKHLRRYLNRFPGCRNAEHSEQVLDCFLLAVVN